MRLLVIGELGWNIGSSHVLREYVRHAAPADMEIAVSRDFGRHDEVITHHLPYTDDLERATHVLVVFEGRPFLSPADIERIDAAVPRRRRAVIDADGHWGRRVAVDGDDNAWPCGFDAWQAQMRAVADVILQPSLATPADGALAFPFYGLAPRAHASAGAVAAETVDVQYVGNNWFRAAPLLEVMSAARQVLGARGRLRVCGGHWDGTTRRGFESATFADPEALRRLAIDVRPPVPFGGVISQMSQALLTPVLVRPVLAALRLLTPRMLETLAADTLPVYRAEDRYLGELYDDGGEFCLGDDPADGIARVLRDRRRLSNVARAIHRNLSRRLSYPVLVRRLRDLLAA